MKRLVAKSIVIKPFEDKRKKSIFLAGPMYTEDVEETDWRVEAVKILDKLNFTGYVYDPTNMNYEEEDLEKQTKWEHNHMKCADAIVFWFNRHIRNDYKMSGMLTNFEYGLYYNDEKSFVGAPPYARRNQYFEVVSKKWYTDLEELLKDVVEYLETV